MKINEKLYDKVKTKTYGVLVIPSTSRGTTGYGETTLNISELNAKEILGVTITSNSTHMLWGCASEINKNPSSLSIYGYRIAGTYNYTIGGHVHVMYI